MTNKVSHIPFLDGLRAIAVLSVLFFHHQTSLIPGGFLGVDVFFVISGFIITSILYREWQSSGKINLTEFWLRRFCRLLPAQLWLLSTVAVYLLIFFDGDELKRLIADVPDALTYALNWSLINSNVPYFEQTARPNLIEHLWSLSIEFQFYIFWPFVCLGLFRFNSRIAAFSTLLLAALSAAWMAQLHLESASTERLYFGTDTRAFALLIGAGVALLVAEASDKKKDFAWSGLVQFISAATTIALLFLLDSDHPYLFLGGAVLTSLMAATFIGVTYLRFAARPPDLLQNILTLKPVSMIGIRAYGIYLWHWPVFCLTQPGVDIQLEGFTLLALRLGITLLLAELSFRLIEKPVNRTKDSVSKLGKINPALGFSFAILLMLESTNLTPLATGLILAHPGEALYAQKTPQGSPLPGMKDKIPGKPVETAEAAGPGTADPALLKSAQTPITDTQPNNSPDFRLQIDKSPIATIQDANKSPEPPPEKQATAEFAAYEYDSAKNILSISSKRGSKPVVTAIGDSVMIGAASHLLESIPDLDIDARVGRQFSAALARLKELKAQDRLGSVLIIHIGNNGPFNARKAEQILEFTNDVEKIYLVTIRVPFNYQQSNNEAFEKLAELNSKVKIIDWQETSDDRGGLFGSDGYHLTRTGARVYAAMITGSVTGSTN